MCYTENEKIRHVDNVVCYSQKITEMQCVTHRNAVCYTGKWRLLYTEMFAAVYQKQTIQPKEKKCKMLLGILHWIWSCSLCLKVLMGNHGAFPNVQPVKNRNITCPPHKGVCYTQKCSVLHLEMQCVTPRSAVCYTQKCSDAVCCPQKCTWKWSLLHQGMDCYTWKCSLLHHACNLKCYLWFPASNVGPCGLGLTSGELQPCRAVPK